MDYIKHAVHLIFPANCLHCSSRVDWASRPLCPECFSQIEWIDRSERCPTCWGPKTCRRCPPLHPHRSLFEALGPLPILYKDFRSSKHPETLASLIILGLGKTSWPLPDFIVPFTSGPLHKSEPVYILAKKVAAELSIPLSLPHPRLMDKTVLFFTDILQSTDTFLKGKHLLQGFFPYKIYSLALIDAR